VGDVQQRLLDTRQALASEQRERTVADTELAATMNDIRSALQTEASDRSRAVAAITASCCDVEASVDGERLARQQAITELSQQLAVAVDSIQEEQLLRCSEDAELSQMLEALQGSVEDMRRVRDDLELDVSRMAREISKRMDEEVRARVAEVAKLGRALSLESEAWHESEGRISRSITSLREGAVAEDDRRSREARELAQRVDSCCAIVKAEQQEPIALAEELRGQTSHSQGSEASRGLQELRKVLDSDSQRLHQLTVQVRELEQRLEQALVAEQKQRAAGLAELVASLKGAVDGEASAREKGDALLSRGTAAVRGELEEGLRRQEATIGELQQLLTDGLAGSERRDTIRSELGPVREGLAKVAEAVQHERRSRSEGMNKLREDCRTAVQKEVSARLESETNLRTEMDAEAQARMEAVEIIELALQELRQHFEMPSRGHSPRQPSSVSEVQAATEALTQRFGDSRIEVVDGHGQVA